MMGTNYTDKSHHTLTSAQKDKTPLFEVNHLSLTFRQYKKGLRESRTQVIRDFSLKVHQGEIVAVVGASGSGKSLLADAILGILPENANVKGDLKFEGEE